MPMPSSSSAAAAAASSACHLDGAACAVGRDECCHGSVCAVSGVCTPAPGSLPRDAPCRRDADCASAACVQVPKGAAAAVGLSAAPRVCGASPST